MRFFVALEIPDQDRAEIASVQQKLQNLIPEARLTDPEKLHITIAFVGEQPDNLKDQLIAIIQNAASTIKPFMVTPSYIDGFPHLHTATTLWIGVNGDIDELYKLRHHIKDSLQELKLMVDQRRFVPHIAIAKLNKFKLTKDIETGLENIMAIPFSPIKVSSIKLFESIPEDGFHQHNTLAQINLH